MGHVAPINTERMAAEVDGEYVVYTNGMRLNKLRAAPKYLRAGLKAGRTFRRLEADPDGGFLGYLPAYTGLRSGAAIPRARRTSPRVRCLAHAVSMAK